MGPKNGLMVPCTLNHKIRWLILRVVVCKGHHLFLEIAQRIPINGFVMPRTLI